MDEEKRRKVEGEETNFSWKKWKWIKVLIYLDLNSDSLTTVWLYNLPGSVEDLVCGNAILPDVKDFKEFARTGCTKRTRNGKIWTKT